MSEPWSIRIAEEPAIRLGGVGKSFPGGIAALRDIALEAKAGELVGLIGANGSGKSTLLRVMAGLTPPDTGTARVFGADPYPRSLPLRLRSTWIPQETALDQEMTGRETLDLFHALHGLAPSGRKAAVDGLARTFGLEEHLHRKAGAYSGGMKRRLHLALGWMRGSDLMLADEPTAALDPHGKAMVWRALAERAGQGAALVAATHDLAEAAMHCHRVGLMDAGELKILDAPDRIIAAHGTATLRIALRETGTDPGALQAGLEAMAGVARVERQPGRILVAGLAKGAGLDPALLAFLQDHRGGIASFQFREADLAGAYFDLTGRTLSETRGANGDRGGGNRGRRG